MKLCSPYKTLHRCKSDFFVSWFCWRHYYIHDVIAVNLLFEVMTNKAQCSQQCFNSCTVNFNGKSTCSPRNDSSQDFIWFCLKYPSWLCSKLEVQIISAVFPYYFFTKDTKSIEGTFFHYGGSCSHISDKDTNEIGPLAMVKFPRSNLSNNLGSTWSSFEIRERKPLN